ncbi:MAG: hypothetical protein JW724_03620 [Candidatus Altiarchaeota archaeon]|nr:hypothetical protein [Candidatus Altiarchaeota archaeon]
MYRSIKVSDDAYKKAKSLGRELERSGEFPGVGKVNLSVAVGYALEKSLDALRKKRVLRESAGIWEDVDTGALKKDIYRSRDGKRRPEARL